MSKLVLSVIVPRNARYVWDPVPGNEFLDLCKKRKLCWLEWTPRSILRSNKIKHVWVKRTKRGSLRYAPGCIPGWRPL